jgi:hypothetical protein
MRAYCLRHQASHSYSPPWKHQISHTIGFEDFGIELCTKSSGMSLHNINELCIEVIKYKFLSK